MPRPRKCSFKEGGRRCPRDGIGDPSLCTLHRIAVATASMPPSPVKVLTDSLIGFLSGKPVNVEATVGAARDAYAQFGAARMGQMRSAPVWPQGPADTRTPNPEEQAVDERAELARLRQLARRELGFGTEPLTEAMIKDRQRKLARKYHPDLSGGSPQKTERLTRKMAAVNAAADVLLEALG